MCVKNLRLSGLCLIICLGVLFFALTGCSKDSELEHIQRAKSNLQEGKIRSAIIEFKNAIQANADSFSARSELGKIYLGVGDAVGAEKELRKALAIKPESSELQPFLLDAYLLQNRFQDVVSRADELLQDKHDALLSALKGEALLGLGNISDASQLINDSIKEKPENPRIMLSTIRLALAKGESEKATVLVDDLLKIESENNHAMLFKSEFKLYGGHYAAAEELSRKIIDLAPKKMLTIFSQNAYFVLAQSLLSQKDYEEANLVVEKMSKLMPSHPMAKYFSALVAYQKGDMDGAEENLHAVVNMLPEHQPSLLLLGTVKFKKGQLEQANLYLEKFVSLSPKHEQGRKLLAMTRMKLNQPAMALEALTPLLSESSVTDAAVLALAGSASIRSGEINKGSALLKGALESDPNNADVRTELALAYIAQSDIKSALDELELAAQQEGSGQLRASSILILTYLRNNDVDSALKKSKELIAQIPDNDFPYNLLGVVYEYGGENDKAMAQYKRAKQLGTGDVRSSLNIARLLQKEGKLKEAYSEYESIMRMEPRNMTAIMSLAQISDKLGDTDQAIRWVNEAISVNPAAVKPKIILARYHLSKGENEKALALINDAAKLLPDHPEVIFTEGLVRMSFGEEDKAEKLFLKSLSIDKDSVSARYQLARIYLKQDKHSESRKLLKEAIKLGPEYFPAYGLLVNLEIASGNFESAMNTVKQMKAKDKNNVLAAILEGDILFRQKKYQPALELYRQVQAKDASNSQLAVKIFNVRLAMSDKKGAYSGLEQWITKYPNDFPVRLMLASSYRKSGNYQLAEKHFRRALEVEPKNVTVLNDLAWLLNELGKQDAIEYAEKAHVLSPDNGAITDTYAWILVQRGDVDRGIVLLDKAVSQMPKHPDIKYHLAAALVKAGKSERAKTILSDLLNSGPPKFSSREDAEALLKRL